MLTENSTIILFIKNEKGIAMPIYVHSNDTIQSIWSECTFSTVITGNSLKGKALFYKDTILERNKNVSDYQISRGSVITLKSVVST
uniref:Ubiquitin-like domain-containing protein n=1 Tax=Panagrolaimus sp. PS1159 TaxID=55785 RepID=A0AC35G0R3_9BILA